MMSDDGWQEWPYPGFGLKVAKITFVAYTVVITLIALAVWLE